MISTLERGSDAGFDGEEHAAEFAADMMEASTECSVVSTDLEGSIELWNEGARRIYGYDRREVVGRSLAMLQPSGADPDPLREMMGAAVRDGAWEGTGERARRDGSRFPARIVLSLRRNGASQPVGFLLISSDASDEVRELEDASAARRQLTVELLNAREEERTRIAGAIHDDPVQSVTAVGIRLDTLAEQASPSQREALAPLRRDVRKAVEDLRGLVFELEPVALRGQGLRAAVAALLEEMSSTSATVALAFPEGEEPDEATAALLYRMTRETLKNVTNHASAERVEVDVEHAGGEWTVRINDDGRGFDPGDALMARPGHLGLASMRERLESAGGSLLVESSVGEGTTITINLPALDPETAGSLP